MRISRTSMSSSSSSRLVGLPTSRTTRRLVETSILQRTSSSSSVSPSSATEDADVDTVVSSCAASSTTTVTSNTTTSITSTSSSTSTIPNSVRQQQRMIHFSIQVHPSVLDIVWQATFWLQDTLNQVVDTLNRLYIAKSVVERLSVFLLLLELLGRNHVAFQLTQSMTVENHQHVVHDQYAIHHLQDEEHYRHYIVTPTSATSSSTVTMLQNIVTLMMMHGAAHNGSSSTAESAPAATTMPIPTPTQLPTTCLVWIFPLLTAIASCCLFASLFVHSIQSIQEQQQQHHQQRQYHSYQYHHHTSSSSSSPETSSLIAAFSSSSSRLGICSIILVAFLQCLVLLFLLGCCMAM
jgi:hypothetical protein